MCVCVCVCGGGGGGGGGPQGVSVGGANNGKKWCETTKGRKIILECWLFLPLNVSVKSITLC